MAAKTMTKKKMRSASPTQARLGKRFASVPVWLAACLCGAACTGFASMHATVLSAPAMAADARTPVSRTVQGRVLDKQDTPITGAVVYLKDTRTLSVKSYLTDDNGRFHFGQLSDGADYEVWAEQKGKRSSSKSISQFNSKLEIQFTLKIDLAK